MKTILTTLLLTSVFSIIYSQEHFIRPILEFPIQKSKNFELVEEVILKDLFIYQEYIDEANTYKYFRVSDSTFYFKHTVKKNILNAGLYKIEQEPVRIDSVVRFDIKTYSEVLSTLRVHQIVKENYWIETINDSLCFKGKYDNSQKVGSWLVIENKSLSAKYAEYANGHIVKLYFPKKKILNQNIAWLTARKYHLCDIRKIRNRDSKKAVHLKLHIDMNTKCFSKGTFEFFPDGNFKYTHNQTSDTSFKDLDGIGSWVINDSGDLEINYSSKAKIVYEIQEISADNIYLFQKD